MRPQEEETVHRLTSQLRLRTYALNYSVRY